jgi:hypothetical protein
MTAEATPKGAWTITGLLSLYMLVNSLRGRAANAAPSRRPAEHEQPDQATENLDQSSNPVARVVAFEQRGRILDYAAIHGRRQNACKGRSVAEATTSPWRARPVGSAAVVAGLTVYWRSYLTTRRTRPHSPG